MKPSQNNSLEEQDGHIWYHKSCTLAGSLVLRGVGGVASSVMSPRPDWVNSSALESLLLLELLDTSSPPAPGVELCRASQLRGDERESRLRKLPLFIENFPSLLYKSNISGLGAANYNYCEQYFFVQTVIFSTSSAR